MSTVPIIEPRAFFALRPVVEKNAHYISDFEILYPAGSVLILHNHVEKRQRFIKLFEKSLLLEVIIVSPSRKLAATIINGEKGQIHVFELKTAKRRRTLSLPPDSNAKRFESICFSCDDKFILALSGDPDWQLLSYNWERGKVETSAKANYPHSTATVSQLFCSPTDSNEICLTGNGLFRLLSMSETVWRQHGFQKADQIHISTAAWLTGDRILCGTTDGKLILIDTGELRAVYDASTVHVIHAKERDTTEPVSSSMIFLRTASALEHEDRQVRTLISFAKGFAYSCRTGTVHMFEKESANRYRKRNVFRVVDPEFRENLNYELNTVKHLSINVSQDKLLATTNRAQLYVVRLWGPNMDVAPEIPFRHLGESLHHGPITGLAVCAWKPIIMTCGKVDRTVRIWNYEMVSLDMLKQYEEDVYSVALHPTGLFATIGLAEKLCFMIILLNDIQTCREFPIRECKMSVFSSHGHYFAATHHSTIYVYSCISFQNVWNLKGHTGKIRGLEWTPDDKMVVSCGTDGAVFLWDTISGKRIGEVITKGVSYSQCTVTSDGKFIYVVGSDGLLKEISGSNILRTINLDQTAMDNMVLSRSDLMMFVCGDLGSVFSVKMPLQEKVESRSFHYHNSRIQQMRLTFDDLTLITVSEAGSLIIWSLGNLEGKAIVLEKDFTYSNEILINKNELEEKILTIRDLSEKLYDLEMDHAYRTRETGNEYNEKIKDIHESYCAAIDELREKIDQMENEQASQLTSINDDVQLLKEKQSKEKSEMEANYISKLEVEYEKFAALDQIKQEMVSEYEGRLVELQNSKEKETSDLVAEYEQKMVDVTQHLEETYEKNRENIKEHETVKQQVEDDADREIVETRASYEKVLKEERENNIVLRGEAGNMKKKYLAAQKEIDEFRQQVVVLHIEHQKYQSIIQALEKDIIDLKKEIIERDMTIQDKDKRIYDLKKKIQELEKFKFVLDYKIKELRNQIDPKDQEISTKMDQIADMEIELENLQRINESLELQLIELREKIIATEREASNYEKKFISGRNVLRQMKVDIYNMFQHFDVPSKLKEDIKNMYHKYNQDMVFIRGQKEPGNTDLQEQFMTQRAYLEKTITALRSTLRKSNEAMRRDGSKVLLDNMKLTEEVNSIRKKLKDTVRKVRDLEDLLGSKKGKMVTPREAYNRLQQTLKRHEVLRKEYDDDVSKAQEETDELETKATNMNEKISTMEDKKAMFTLNL